jgi:hypothetical protein
MFTEEQAERIVRAFEQIAAALSPRDKGERRKPGAVPEIEAEFLAAWNTMSGTCGLSRCEIMTARDRRNLKERIAELKRAGSTDDAGAMVRLKAIIATIPKQPFALGRVTGKSWKIDAHQFLTDSKFAAVEAGSYGEKTGNCASGTGRVTEPELFG